MPIFNTYDVVGKPATAWANEVRTGTVVASPNLAIVTYQDGTRAIFLGSGLSFSGGFYTGTITAVQHVPAGASSPVYEEVVALSVPANTVLGAASNNAAFQVLLSGGDVLNGSAGNDALYGFNGDDFLIGGAGTDTLNGGDGNDTLFGGPAAEGQHNIVDGGAGTNTLSYAGTDVPVYVDLQTGGGHVGGILVDLFSNISNVTGGGDNDLLVGNASGNVFEGGGGADQIYGYGGADTFKGGINLSGTPSQIFGGDGPDTIDYGAQNGTVYVDLRAPAGYVKVGANYVLTDLLNSVERVAGGAGNDLLIGNDENNVISGGAGADEIHGLGGNDQLSGGTASPGSFNQLFGDAGTDQVVYSDVTDSLYISLEIKAAYRSVSGSYVLNDTFDSIEWIAGGQSADILVGDSGANQLAGRAGADILYGRSGNDVFMFYGAADSNTTTGYDTIADFEKGVDKLNLENIVDTLSRVVIHSVGSGPGGSTALYADTNTSMPGYEFAVSFLGANAITTADLLI